MVTFPDEAGRSGSNKVEKNIQFKKKSLLLGYHQNYAGCNKFIIYYFNVQHLISQV